MCKCAEGPRGQHRLLPRRCALLPLPLPAPPPGWMPSPCPARPGLLACCRSPLRCSPHPATPSPPRPHRHCHPCSRPVLCARGGKGAGHGAGAGRPAADQVAAPELQDGAHMEAQLRAGGAPHAWLAGGEAGTRGRGDAGTRGSGRQRAAGGHTSPACPCACPCPCPRCNVHLAAPPHQPPLSLSAPTPCALPAHRCCTTSGLPTLATWMRHGRRRTC